ncbi:glycosyltransferase family 2 protein [Thiovibrio frasassiensis]|uniref:Glycosyltransferase n=1 Tax=Thiovibrio frasassiensis TaxID=2984131 RepID=A0A9X4MGN5_9BACT|nr:glycosyltransferase family 2 protein [Thiovibrio frasassiensis]MDG4476043.1 glycosyltransferase [Thiovibrio frasassiensis]
MSDKSPPLISIIVAVFNGVDALQQCIDSVATQTYLNKELIVIDGGSEDGTVAIIEASREKIDYWVSEVDGGVYNAWNKGLSKAKGEWICFLGADDYLLGTEVLAQISARLEKIPQSIRVVYAQIMLLSAGGEALFPVGEPWEKMKVRFRQGLCLPHQGVMHRRSLFEQNGKFDESFRIGGDYELMLRELKTANAVFIPDIIPTAMRQGGLSSNPSSSIQAMRDVRRAQKMHGQYFPGFFWLMAMMRVYVRLVLWDSIGERPTRKIFDLGRRIKGLPPYWTRI